MGQRGGRPPSVHYEDNESNQFITNYEAEMSALKPRDSNKPRPESDVYSSDAGQCKCSYLILFLIKITATLPDPMGNTGLKQRLIKEDNDLGLITSEYAPRLDRTKSKVDSFEVSSTKHVPSPDSEWVSFCKLSIFFHFRNFKT